MTRLALLRSKKFIATYGPYLLVIFLLVGVFSLGIAGWERTHPPTTEVTDVTHEQTVRSELQTSAITTGETTLYNRGAELVNEQKYLFASAPRIKLSQLTSVPSNQSVSVDQDMTLVYEVADGGEIFWRESQPLAQTTTTTDSGEVKTQSTVDLNDVRTRRSEIQNDIGQDGRVNVRISVSISYDTGQNSDKLTATYPVRMGDKWYEIADEELKQTHRDTNTREKPVPTRNSYTYSLPAGIGLVSLLCAFGIGFVYYKSGIDQRCIERQLQKSRYQDWISAGSLSPPIDERIIRTESLADLIDVAIDIDKRAIHDQGRELYAVVDTGVIYCYSPDGFDMNETGGADSTVTSSSEEMAVEDDATESFGSGEATLRARFPSDSSTNKDSVSADATADTDAESDSISKWEFGEQMTVEDGTDAESDGESDR